MSRSLSRLQAVVLAAVVLAGLVLAGTGLFAVGSRHWPGSDTFRVSGGFADIGGVEVGTRVRIQGIDAGEVEAVDLPLSAGEPVTLRLRLAGRFRGLVGDPETARVQIGSEGLFAGKFVKIIPGRPWKEPLPDDVVLKSQPVPELTEELAQASTRLKHVLGQLDEVLQGVRKGEGTLGRLVMRDDAHAETLRALGEVRGLAASVKQNSDAIKTMPIVRSYVVDPHKLLNRPDCAMERQWLPESKLFPSGRAVLTPQGRKELARLGSWLNERKVKGSQVVVAAYAAPGLGPEAAQTLTQKQSEVVRDYLTTNFKVHKTGWWWWSRRAVKAVGCGTMASPIPGDARHNLPAPRVEVLVFVPQK